MSAPSEAILPLDLAASPDRAAALLALNNAHATELSLLDAARFAALATAAFHAARIGEADAFLLAFDQDAAYDSSNFLWFRNRFERFVYVDRVVVAPQARGRGLARRLYDDLIRRAQAAGHPRIVCEVNEAPPNPASEAFHRSLGFTDVGAGPVPGGDKIVRYKSRALPVRAEALP